MFSSRFSPPITRSGYGCDPVSEFVKQHGKRGNCVLSIFNAQDPMQIADGILDEYVGYAERFLQEVRHVSLTGNFTLEFVREATRRSFHIRQIVDGWVLPEQLEKLAQELFNTLRS